MMGLRITEPAEVADECQPFGQSCLGWRDARTVHNGATQRWLHQCLMPQASTRCRHSALKTRVNALICSIQATIVATPETCHACHSRPPCGPRHRGNLARGVL